LKPKWLHRGIKITSDTVTNERLFLTRNLIRDENEKLLKEGNS
jgi:hypothetical protein